MSTVGDQLRTAREARKLRVQEVAEATNMRTDHVLALERGDYSPFPAPVYIRGSVRTYAKLLKLDVMKIMDDLAAELDQQHHPDQTPGATGRSRGLLDVLALWLVRFGWKRAIFTLAFLAVLVLILLVRGGRTAQPESDPLSDLPPPTYQPSKNAQGGYLPLPNTNR